MYVTVRLKPLRRFIIMLVVQGALALHPYSGLCEIFFSFHTYSDISFAMNATLASLFWNFTAFKISQPCIFIAISSVLTSVCASVSTLCWNREFGLHFRMDLCVLPNDIIIAIMRRSKTVLHMIFFLIQHSANSTFSLYLIFSSYTALFASSCAFRSYTLSTLRNEIFCYMFQQIDGISCGYIAVQTYYIFTSRDLANMTYFMIDNMLWQCVPVVAHHRWPFTPYGLGVEVWFLSIGIILLIVVSLNFDILFK